MSITVEQVRTRQQVRQFQAVPAWYSPAEVAARVPLLTSDIAAWQAGSSWFGDGVTLWLARDHTGAVVGRTTSHHSDAMDTKLGHPTQLFGATEFATTSALAALLNAVEGEARVAGRTHLLGPVSLLPNETGGVVVHGNENPGFFDSAWNPPGYAQAYAQLGFEPFSGGWTWEVDLGEVPAARATAPSHTELLAAGIRILQPGRLTVRRVLTRVLPTLNEAFAPLPYYTQISKAQFASQTAGLEALMESGLIVAAESVHSPDRNPPVDAFILVVPDVADSLRASNGALNHRFLWDVAHARFARNRPRDAVLIIQGARPHVQGRGITSLLARQLFSTLISKGFRRLRVTFIGDDNPASSAIPRKAGGRPLHCVRFFTRKLS